MGDLVIGSGGDSRSISPSASVSAGRISFSMESDPTGFLTTIEIPLSDWVDFLDGRTLVINDGVGNTFAIVSPPGGSHVWASIQGYKHG